MSSILKALKKIEGDSPLTHSSLSKSIASIQVQKSNSGKRRRKILYLFLILLVIAVVTVMAYGQRRLIVAKIMSIVSSEAPTAGKSPESSRTEIHRAKVPRLSAKPAPKPPVVIRRPKTQAKKAVPASRDKKIQASTRSSKQRAITATSPSQTPSGMRAPAASLNSRVKKPPKKDLPPPASAPGNKTTAKKDTKTTAPAARTEIPARTRPGKNYERFTDSKLKLQALAWSEDAARRMAVINGHIVHEGESVDGYQVVKIRTEDVIVKEGGKSWSLEFGLRQ